MLSLNKVQAKKIRCCLDFSKQHLTFALVEYRSIRLKVGESHMYTLDSPILYSEAARGERISGQHPKCLHILLRFSRNAVPIGFCCGGFTSTAGYVPGNEAHSFR